MIELGIYIAGPLYSSGDLVTNTRAACDAAQQLERASIPSVKLRPFVPHICVLSWQLVHPRSHGVAQEWDDFWLRKCDVLLRLPGKSTGSDHEEELARELHKPVFYEMRSLVKWAWEFVE